MTVQQLTDVRRKAHQNGKLVFLRLPDHQQGRFRYFIESIHEDYIAAGQQKVECFQSGGGYWTRTRTGQPPKAKRTFTAFSKNPPHWQPVRLSIGTSTTTAEYAAVDADLQVEGQISARVQFLQRQPTERQPTLNFAAATTQTPRAVRGGARSSSSSPEQQETNKSQDTAQAAAVLSDAHQTKSQDTAQAAAVLSDAHQTKSQDTAQAAAVLSDAHQPQSFDTSQEARANASVLGAGETAFSLSDSQQNQPLDISATQELTTATATSQVQPEGLTLPERGDIPHQQQQRDRVRSLEWDNSDLALRTTATSPEAATNAPVRTNMAERVTYLEKITSEFKAAHAADDERVRKLGKLLADIENLHNAINRSNNYKDNGYPVVLPLGRQIQTPCPELITDDMITELNTVMNECADRLTEVVTTRQRDHVKKLEGEAARILREWEPTAEEVLGIQRVKAARVTQIRLYPDHLNPNPGILSFFTAPDISKGERLIVPNYDTNRIQSTGMRHPAARGRQGRSTHRNGNRDRQQSRSRQRHPSAPERESRDPSTSSRGPRDDHDPGNNRRGQERQDGGYHSPPPRSGFRDGFRRYGRDNDRTGGQNTRYFNSSRGGGRY